MKRIRKMLAVILGAVLLMFVAAMFGPRTAHAIVAALVQVVNTPTNAVNELHAPAASAIYENSCDIYVGGGGGNVASCQMPAAPPGETLVVEAVSIFAEPPYPESYAYLSQIGNGYYTSFVPMNLVNGSYTGTLAVHQYFLSGVAPSCGVVFNGFGSGGLFVGICYISGYTVPSS